MGDLWCQLLPEFYREVGILGDLSPYPVSPYEAFCGSGLLGYWWERWASLHSWSSVFTWLLS